MTRTTKTRLGIDTLEARECPAAFVYDDYCGNGIPRPPIPPVAHSDQIRVAVANPEMTKVVVAINTAVTPGVESSLAMRRITVTNGGSTCGRC